MPERWAKVVLWSLWAMVIVGGIATAGWVLHTNSNDAWWWSALRGIGGIVGIVAVLFIAIEIGAQRRFGRRLRRNGWPRVWGLSLLSLLNEKTIINLPPYEELAVLPWNQDYSHDFPLVGKETFRIMVRIGGTSPHQVLNSALGLKWLLQHERQLEKIFMWDAE